MGGSCEKKISGIRMHINNGDVHVHDDNKNLKFETSVSDFKEEVKDALNQFKKKEGIIKITGKNDDLYLLKEGNKTNIFLLEEKSDVTKELESFLKDC